MIGGLKLMNFVLIKLMKLMKLEFRASYILANI